MAMGEEVGDAYISVHADTQPFYRETAKMRKENAKAFKAMDKDAKEFDKTLSEVDKTKGKNRGKIAQLQDALRDIQNQGKSVKRDSGKWISPELNKSLDAAIRKNELLGRTLRDTFGGKDLADPKVKKALEAVKVEVRKNIKEMTALSRASEKAAATQKKKLADGVNRANVRLIEQRHKISDLRGEFTKMKSAAKAIGDDDFAAKMHERLTKLQTITRSYEKDIVNITKGSEEWHKRTTAMSQALNGLNLASHKDNETLKEKVHLYEETVKESKAVQKETKVLGRETKKVTAVTHKLGNEMQKTEKKGNSLSRGLKKMSTKLGGSFRRMDSTVKLVIGLIVVAGNLAAGLGAGLGAGMVAVASAAVLAAAALSPLLGVIVPLAYGFVLLKKSFTDAHGNFTLEKVAKMAPEAADGMKHLGEAVKKIDAGALFREWNDSLATFTNKLADSLVFDTVAQNIGKAFTKITDGLTAVLDSPVWTEFVDAVEGPLTTAFGNFGAAIGPLVSTLLEFLTAAAPFAVILSEQFLDWAKGLQAAFHESVASGEFEAFMTRATDALDSMLDLFGAIGDALGTVFLAGAPAGIELLDMITGFIDQFNTWANTFEGQSALKTWFQEGVIVMTAVFDLLGKLGTALGDLVTPAVIQDVVEFLGAVGDILPVITDILNIIGKAHILDLFTEAIKLIGAAIEPIVEPMSKFLEILSGQLLSIMEALAPSFTVLGEAIGAIFTALTPLLPVLGGLVVTLIESLAPILPIIADMFVDVVTALVPFVSQLITDLAPILPVIIGAFLTLVKAVAPFIPQLVEGLAPILPLIADILKTVADNIGVLLPIALEILMPLMDNLISILPDLVELIDSLIPLFVTSTDLLVQLSPLFEALAEEVNNGVTIFFAFVDTIINLINWFIGLVTKIGHVRTAFVNFVKDNPVFGWFSDLHDEAMDAFDGIVTAVKNVGTAIENAFKTAFNRVSAGWNATIGSLSWTIPSWIPGPLGGHTISVPDMPIWNAAGGIATTPTIAGFGEAGPEALVPLNRPLNQVDPSVRGLSAIAQGLAGSGMNISEGAIVINTPSGNGRVIAESVLDRIVAYSR